MDEVPDAHARGISPPDVIALLTSIHEALKQSPSAGAGGENRTRGSVDPCERSAFRPLWPYSEFLPPQGALIEISFVGFQKQYGSGDNYSDCQR
eukprot:6558800-Karenia_brevis.AAC.1